MFLGPSAPNIMFVPFRRQLQDSDLLNVLHLKAVTQTSWNLVHWSEKQNGCQIIRHDDRWNHFTVINSSTHSYLKKKKLHSKKQREIIFQSWWKWPKKKKKSHPVLIFFFKKERKTKWLASKTLQPIPVIAVLNNNVLKGMVLIYVWVSGEENEKNVKHTWICNFSLN